MIILCDSSMYVIVIIIHVPVTEHEHDTTLSKQSSTKYGQMVEVVTVINLQSHSLTATGNFLKS